MHRTPDPLAHPLTLVPLDLLGIRFLRMFSI